MTIKTSMSECAREPFTIDWTAFYEEHGLDIGTNPITLSEWTVTDGTKADESIVAAETTVFLSGGTVGTPILAENKIEIENGIYIDCRTLEIEVF